MSRSAVSLDDLCALAFSPNHTVFRWPSRELAMPIAMPKNSAFEVNALCDKEWFEMSCFEERVLRHNKFLYKDV